MLTPENTIAHLERLPHNLIRALFKMERSCDPDLNIEEGWLEIGDAVYWAAQEEGQRGILIIRIEG
tara:strand:- start:451 stop:648 length:198 start_codon:yes stop_codon:yes gene_type:complete